MMRAKYLFLLSYGLTSRYVCLPAVKVLGRKYLNVILLQEKRVTSHCFRCVLPHQLHVAYKKNNKASKSSLCFQTIENLINNNITKT